MNAFIKLDSSVLNTYLYARRCVYNMNTYIPMPDYAKIKTELEIGEVYYCDIGIEMMEGLQNFFVYGGDHIYVFNYNEIYESRDIDKELHDLKNGELTLDEIISFLNL